MRPVWRKTGGAHPSDQFFISAIATQQCFIELCVDVVHFHLWPVRIARVYENLGCWRFLFHQLIQGLCKQTNSFFIFHLCVQFGNIVNGSLVNFKYLKSGQAYNLDRRV